MSTCEYPLSPQRTEWLKKRRRRHVMITSAKVGILLFIIFFWEFAARASLIDPFITSSPSRVMDTLVGLSLSGELWRHLAATVMEAAAGFILGTVFGTLVAIALWCSDFLCQVLEPYLVILNALPKIALGPVFIVWLGAGKTAIIVITLSVSIVVAILEVLGGFLSTDKEKIRLAETFGANKFEVLRRVVLPSNVPTILGSLKINVGMSWVGVIVGEFLISREGLGYLIVYGSQVFQLDLVMASVVVLAVVAALMYLSIQWVEKKLSQRRGG